MPVTVPTVFTMAIVVLLLLHTPPATPSVSVMSPLWQREEAPEIAPITGDGLTTTDSMANAAPQLLVTEYEIIALPTAIPVATPVAEPMVTIEVLLLLHTPPDAASNKVVPEPTHTADAPETVPAKGNGSTVIIFVV